MSDFCKQCAEEMGFETVDLAGIVGPGTKYPRAEWYHTICEGCVRAVVDKDGKCHSESCLKKHGNRGYAGTAML